MNLTDFDDNRTFPELILNEHERLVTSLQESQNSIETLQTKFEHLQNVTKAI